MRCRPQVSYLWPIWMWPIWSVADMDIFCGRYELFVADMVVADMVCGRYRRNSLQLGNSVDTTCEATFRYFARTDKIVDWSLSWLFGSICISTCLFLVLLGRIVHSIRNITNLSDPVYRFSLSLSDQTDQCIMVLHSTAWVVILLVSLESRHGGQMDS